MKTSTDLGSGHTCALRPVDDALAQEWDRLAVRRNAAPHLRPGWFRVWMDAFRPGQTLSLLSARHHGELVAALPLVVTRFGLRLPVNSETPSFEPLSTDDGAARALAAALLGRFRRVDLRFVPTGAPEEALVAAARERGCRVVREVARRSPYTRVDHDWDVLRDDVLGRSRRKSIARRRRQLAELGTVSFEVHDGTGRWRDLLAEGLALEAAGWKGTQKTATLSRPSTTAFYHGLAEWAAGHGLLRLHVLRLDEKPIAFEFALEQSGVVHVLKTAYDENLRRYGPGILILDDGLGDASRQPHLHVSESLGEDEPYKLEFSTGVREQLDIAIFSNDVLGSAARAWRSTAAHARDQARRRLPESARLRLVRLATMSASR